MKKKVLYGVALALFAGVSVGSLQSCKDDVNDLATQTSFNLSSLQQQLKDEAQKLQDQINLKANAADLADYAKLDVVNGLIARVEALENRPTGSTYDDTELRNLYAQLNGAVSTLQTDFGNLSSLLSQLQTEIDQKLGDMQGSQDALKSELEGKIDANKAAIEDLDKYVKETLQGELDNEFTQVYLQIQEAKEWISQVYNVLSEQLDETNLKVDEISDQITAIADILNAIIGQLDHNVTGLLIQGVKSPVFGDFRLPIGVKNNILFNWYGYNDRNKSVEFPSNEAAFSATGAPNLDLAKLNPAGKVAVAPGYYGDVLLGKVYVTVNPVGANHENLELSIEPSAGDPLPLKVVLTPSDEVLYQGYSRSVENGFYEGDVVMEANDENIKTIAVTIDEDLKTSMKNALKDPSKRTAASLLKAVYDQLSGKFPAYALRYDWTTGAIPSLEDGSMDPSFSLKANAVLSQYDLAVATARPLSFNFLEGVSINHKLPTISPIENLIQKLIDEGDFNIKIDPIEIEGAHIDIGQLTISTDVTMENKPSIVINLGGIEVKDDAGHVIGSIPADKTITLDGENGDLADVYAAIESGMHDALEEVKTQIDNWSENLDTNVNGQLNSILDDIQGQINSMISSINGQIDEMVENIADKFQGVFDKVNKAFDIYNKIANKVNNILDDPNAYLQVTALYNMNGGYGFVSGDVTRPTTFTQAGGNAFSLYLTSYTGELIVPSYKKYVAVTGVYKNGVRDNNADLTALNGGNDLNKVLDGSAIRVTVPAGNFVKGNVYEFTYQALDYRGYTSTRKFYIEVK